jgi:hypothetical protein
MGRVKAEPRARGGTDPVERDDPEHERAGGVADAVDDNPLSAVSNGGVFALVLVDEAAIVLADTIIRKRGASRSSDYAYKKKVERCNPGPSPRYAV